MFVLLAAALILLLSGSTFLKSALDQRTHPAWFILFWLICAWLTLSAMLLAIFDLLVVRLDARNAQRELRKTFDISTSISVNCETREEMEATRLRQDSGVVK